MKRSRKDSTMIVAIAAMLMFAVFNFLFKPQRNDLSSARSQLQNVERDISDVELMLKAPATTTAQQSKASSTAIPESPEMPGLLRTLYAVAGASEVTLASVGPNPLTANPSGPGGSLTVSITASGSHPAILTFLQQLRDMDRLAVVEQIGVVAQPATEAVAASEQVQLTVRVFTQLSPVIAPVATPPTSTP